MIQGIKIKSLNTLDRFPITFYGVIAISLFFGFTSQYFFTSSNILNLGMQTSVLAIISVGMALTIISGGVDLSMGTIIALAGIVMAFLTKQGLNSLAAIVGAIVISGMFGCTSGIIISVGRVSPIMVTLGMLGVAQGIGLAISGGGVIHCDTIITQFIGGSTIIFVPATLWITLILIIFVYIILNFTSFGIHIYAVGDNERVAISSGIRVQLCITLVYTLSGILAGCAGIILSSSLLSGSSLVGLGREFDAIVACIVGGIVFGGGQGSVGEALSGALLIAVLKNGLTLLKYPTEWQMAITGATLILFVISGIFLQRFRNS